MLITGYILLGDETSLIYYVTTKQMERGLVKENYNMLLYVLHTLSRDLFQKYMYISKVFKDE